MRGTRQADLTDMMNGSSDKKARFLENVQTPNFEGNQKAGHFVCKGEMKRKSGRWKCGSYELGVVTAHTFT